MKIGSKPAGGNGRKKLSSASYVIQRINRILGRKSALVAYRAVFGSHISYG